MNFLYFTVDLVAPLYTVSMLILGAKFAFSATPNIPISLTRSHTMLRNAARIGSRRAVLLRPSVKNSPISKVAKRFLSEEPSEVFTKINDAKDPQRNQFFQYSWGTWLKNDKIEKARRETRFSIEGATEFVRKLEIKDGELEQPFTLATGATILPQNITRDLLGEGDIEVKSIASIHEGKHHRVYQLLLKNDKSLVLRIPYKLESDFAIESKIKSEVATMDFLKEKLDLNVPRVLAYGATRNNSLLTPFILMEYIEGDLLMKQWDPLAKDTADNADLKKVINPIADFQTKMLEISFNKIGSLYFYDDVKPEHQATEPYAGETDEKLKDRWRIGPLVENVYSKNKKHLAAQKITELSGPFDADKPLDLIKSVAKIQLESLKSRLALAQADAGSKVENIEDLKKQILTFENFEKVSEKLVNPTSPAIMNCAELFKPRLYAPDLDPLNVIVEKDSGKHYFLDFEYSAIKPFVFTSYPPFVAYQGAKVFNLEEDVEGYKDMDDVEKLQYEFMYHKTRNERIWEHALNDRRHDLIAVASPHLKLLKAPYLQASEVKNDKDYMFVENAIIQLRAMWDTYVANQLTNADEAEFPIEYSAEHLDRHAKDLSDYQMEVVSTPFAATSGWVPQDMFETLKKEGILVQDENGDYHVLTEAALKDEKKSE